MVRFGFFTVLFLVVVLPSGWTSECEPGGLDVETSSGPAVEMSCGFALGGEYVDQTSEILIRAVNLKPRPGVLVIEATLMSARGIESIREAATAPLLEESPVVVGIPVSRLDLPALGQGIEGLIALSGFVRFADGSVEPVSPHLDVVFRSEGKGWRIFGENASEENGRFSELGMRNEALSKPAYSRKVSETTSWRPADDESILPALPKAATDRAGVKICVQQMSAFSDAGIGEDFWTSSASTARASRGAWVAILREGSYLWVDFLGDGRGAGDPGSGCTEVLAEPPDPTGTYDYTMQIWTVGNVQGNAINTAYNGNPVLDWTFTRSLTGTGTFEVTFDPTANTGKAFDVYMVGAYCLYRHAAGLSGETFRYRLDAGSSNSSVDRVNDTVRIGDLRADRKFIIAHETGHLLGDFATGNNDWKTVNTGCQCFEGLTCPAEYGSHTMISKERSRCAMAEGFAHFYAAAVFNSHTDDSPYECWFHYYKEIDGDSTPIVNCELDWPDGPFDEAFMEGNCGGPWDGMGTELDWMRTFWDVLSDPPAADTMEAVLEWIDNADYWYDYSAFNSLDQASNLIGGDFDGKWDIAKTRNGVDWPQNSRLFDNSFESGAVECWDQ